MTFDEMAHVSPVTTMPTQFQSRLAPDSNIGHLKSNVPYGLKNKLRSIFYENVNLGVMGRPYHCIGKVLSGIDDRTINSGTGVLVGRNVLLTASHTAMWDAPPGRWWMRFFPAFFDGPSPNLGSSFVERFRGFRPQPHPFSHDFVVCKLFNPLGDALGFMGTFGSTGDSFYYSRRWWSVGYPASVGGRRPVMELEIKVKDIDNNGDGREIETDFNNYILNGGWSGGPLWGFLQGGDARVIGICSGWEMDGWDPPRTVFAGGIPLVNLVRDAHNGIF